MIRTSPNTTLRAAAVVLAAAVLPFLAPRASAQQVVDLLGGTIGTPAALSTTPTTATASGTFGPGFTGTVTSNVSLNNTISEGFLANGASNSYYVTQSGLVEAGGTAVATKSFGSLLAPTTTYSFTLTTSNAAAISLLGNFNIALYNGNPATSLPFVDTVSGTGLGGLGVNLLGLFNGGNTASFTFTTPAAYNPANGLAVSFTSNLPVGGLNGSVVFNGASINQVPEPGTVAAMLLGAGGLVALRFRRRLAAV